MASLWRRMAAAAPRLLLAVADRPKPALSSRITLSACSTKAAAAPPTVVDRLMEFFDEPKNWEAENIKCGRAWRKEELRIKSNQDLHKLWFVLLKEKNMLLTMEHECKREYQVFPNPERLDKVEESMENLELVVRERNKAYFELETTQSAERPAEYKLDQIGMKYFYKSSEHLIPKVMNRKWRATVIHGFTDRAVSIFLRKLREKKMNKEAWVKHCQRKRVSRLQRYMPHISDETLRAAFPEVDIEAAKDHKDALGNHEHNRA